MGSDGRSDVIRGNADGTRQEPAVVPAAPAIVRTQGVPIGGWRKKDVRAVHAQNGGIPLLTLR